MSVQVNEKANPILKKNSRPDYIQSNWVNDKTWDFIYSLSFQGYILAGNSVSNMYEKIPLQGDLDFWFGDFDDFVDGFKEMAKFYTHFNLYPSMIEMYNDEDDEDNNNNNDNNDDNKKNSLPKINLIYTNLSPSNTINRFDFPYCRAYWTPQTGINIDEHAKIAIQNKFISWTEPTSPLAIKFKRILKAVTYGYNFTYDFWYQLRHLNLISNSKKITNSRSIEPFDIQLEDLDLKKFELVSIPIDVTNKSNVILTLEEIAIKYKQIALKLNVKLPILLTFNSGELNLIIKYINSIIMLNPLKNTNYLEVRIGTHFVYYGDKYTKYFHELKPKVKEWVV